MRRVAVILAVLAAALALPGQASAIGQCGLPSNGPWWVDFGALEVADVFAREGVILGVSTGDFPARMRSAGAKTVYWDMYLNRRVGTPSAPASPATIVERANRLFDFAAAQSGCEKPVIALNELFGASLEAPWSATNRQYRANVLTLIRTLAARGARPFLLISSAPYTEGEAGEWWREAAQHADLVPEVYFNAAVIHKQGAILGNRRMRTSFRRAVRSFLDLGIPRERIGLVLGFQSRRGTGGREGLAPASAWFETVKWQALAARQVVSETGIASVWSWGWGAFSEAARDADKPAAACVYLWTRDARLCNGVAVAGASFNASLTDGQIRLRGSTQCGFSGGRRISSAGLSALVRVTGDRDVAYSALLARLAESPYAGVPTSAVLPAERAVIALRFGGSPSAYRAALADAGATVTIARSVLADELRRLRIEPRMRARSPSAREVSAFYFGYPDLMTRTVVADPAPWWLGGRTRGLAFQSLAPEQLFQLAAGRRVFRALDGVYRVNLIGEPRVLGTIPFDQARGAISAALRTFERRAAFERWSLGRQASALGSAICRGDDVPTPSTIRLTGYLPFLSLAGS